MRPGAPVPPCFAARVALKGRDNLVSFKRSKHATPPALTRQPAGGRRAPRPASQTSARRRVKGLTAIKRSCSRKQKAGFQQRVISPAARRGPGARARGTAAEPIVWARRGAGCLEAGWDGVSRAGRWARRGASCQPASERSCARSPPARRGCRTHARPARAPGAGSARLAATWRVSGWSL